MGPSTPAMIYTGDATAGQGPRPLLPWTRGPGSAAPDRLQQTVLFRHVLDQIEHAVAVAPLVVVPAHQLEEVGVQLNACLGIVDARERTGDEIAADDFVLGVPEETLHRRLGG